MSRGGVQPVTEDDHENDDDEVRQLVVLVDPYSTGCLIGQEMAKRGCLLVALWTKGFSDAMKLHVPTSVGRLDYYAELNEAASLEETAEAVKQAAGRHELSACLAGGEAGVDLADALSEFLQLRTNGTSVSNRRDKQVQQDLVRKVGLRSVRGAGGTEFQEVEAFLQRETFPVIVKPVESAGSDGVKLCHTMQEAKEHFNLLMKSQMVNGGDCPAVLCQEFLRGKEYVVDHVSRDGVHKTMMVWVYDKRPANGSAFVYYGCLPVDPKSPEAQIVIPYIRSVLDALGFTNGPSHGEVMMTANGPCLVEMNCRAHGGDGNWRPLCKALTGGYSQVEATVSAYLDAPTFEALPDLPPSPFLASGQEVILVSYSKGKVSSTPGFDVLKALPSFVCLETSIGPGSEVDYTVDLFTGIGSVILMHADKALLQRDVQFVRTLEEINGLFLYETRLESLSRPQSEAVVMASIAKHDNKKAGGTHRRVFSSEGPMLIRHLSNDRPDMARFAPLVKRVTTVDASKEVVVLVDAYSTGSLIAEEISKRGFSVVALWTKGFSPEMKQHIPLSVTQLNYVAELEEAATLDETVKLIHKAAGPKRVVACLAGGEAGVDLADALSEKLQVRTNGTAIPNKRDKKIQQELIQKRGLRSTRQACGATFAEVSDFLKREAFPVVLKPVESAGSDGVKLCHNFDEAKEHFDLLMASQMVNGGDCPAVLCQEFLRGKEYVVDHVSRNGEHKTVMVWVYDKRPANGSAFVYFGCVPVDAEGPEAKLLIPYVRRVLDALDLKNGPSHAEVMMTADGPCLVEMNCRAHGGDGNWRPLCRALTGGYSQVEATADAYLDHRQFTLLPSKPPSPFKASGQEVILVSFSRGQVKETPGFEQIKQLPSFVYLETGVRAGSLVDYTVDLFTGIGSVILMHSDKQVLEQDVQTIRTMERDNKLFTYEPANTVFFKSPSTLDLNTIPTKLVSSANRPDLY